MFLNKMICLINTNKHTNAYNMRLLILASSVNTKCLYDDYSSKLHFSFPRNSVLQNKNFLKYKNIVKIKSHSSSFLRMGQYVYEISIN